MCARPAGRRKPGKKRGEGRQGYAFASAQTCSRRCERCCSRLPCAAHTHSPTWPMSLAGLLGSTRCLLATSRRPHCCVIRECPMLPLPRPTPWPSRRRPAAPRTMPWRRWTLTPSRRCRYHPRSFPRAPWATNSSRTKSMCSSSWASLAGFRPSGFCAWACGSPRRLARHPRCPDLEPGSGGREDARASMRRRRGSDARRLTPLKLTISSKPDAGMPHTIDLPLSDPQEAFAFVSDAAGALADSANAHLCARRLCQLTADAKRRLSGGRGGRMNAATLSLQFDLRPAFGSRLIGRGVGTAPRCPAAVHGAVSMPYSPSRSRGRRCR